MIDQLFIFRMLGNPHLDFMSSGANQVIRLCSGQTDVGVLFSHVRKFFINRASAILYDI